MACIHNLMSLDSIKVVLVLEEVLVWSSLEKQEKLVFEDSSDLSKTIVER